MVNSVSSENATGNAQAANKAEREQAATDEENKKVLEDAMLNAVMFPIIMKKVKESLEPIGS